jgi:hypothetical protein
MNGPILKDGSFLILKDLIQQGIDHVFHVRGYVESLLPKQGLAQSSQAMEVGLRLFRTVMTMPAKIEFVWGLVLTASHLTILPNVNVLMFLAVCEPSDTRVRLPDLSQLPRIGGSTLRLSSLPHKYGICHLAGINATTTAIVALNYTDSTMNVTGVKTHKPTATMNQPGCTFHNSIG